MMSAETRPTSGRLLFIDMFRGLVTLIMIEGHVTNTTILYSLRGTKTFHYLDILNGMVAPSFIFIAGFAFALALEKKWKNFLTLDRTFWLQLKRLLFILGVGYWLHLPVWSFWQLIKLPRESILYFLRCDVLQLISISLIISLFLVVLLRNRKSMIISLLTLSLTIVFVTPFVYDIDPRNYFPPLLSDYINTQHYALFPLFPWSAYAFLGAFLCWIYLRARERNQAGKFFLVIAVLGVLMFIGGFALFYVPWSYHTYVDPARSSPRQFMLKVGFIFFTLAGYWLYEQHRRPVSSWMNMVGQESLFVYGFHLIFVYGASFMPHYIGEAVGPNLTYAPSLLLSFLLISSSAVAGLIWHLTKRNHPILARRIFWILCAGYFIPFFVT